MSYKTKLISVALSVTTVALLSGAAVPMIANAALTGAQVQSILSLLQSFGADQTTINNVNASLHGQATTPTTPSLPGSCTFTRDLKVGSKGNDVSCLQGYLNVSPASGYFGQLTKAAVIKWQSSNGVAPAAGYFGAKSRAKYSAVVASGPATPPSTPPPTTPPPAGAAGTLTVAAGTQPSASLFPINSVRVPFTVVAFTAGGADVTVNSLLVERTGLSADTAFSGIVLLDETGNQVGLAKTLNSIHQTLLNTAFVVKAGTTRTMTIAGNAETSNNSLAGQVPYLTLDAVNSTATSVSGALPISGVGQTVNESLTIGSVTMQRGPLDPGTSVTKKVGDANGYIFSSVKVTAGSAEQVYLKFIRWNQTGSVAASDLANIKTYVDGTGYDAVVTSDGKYYVSTFTDNNGQGILIDKGFSKEVYVKGDIVSGSGRTVIFNIAKRTDIGLVGATYHYGITPPATGSSVSNSNAAAFSSSEDPWYDAAKVTVSTGSLTVNSDTTIPAQNIGINVANQPLGGFQVVVKGEQISVGKLIFHINTTGTGVPSGITNITLVDPNGAVVAGPNDGAVVVGPDGKVTFTSTVTFPVGTGTYVLKGKIGTSFANNDTVAASTTPSTDWTTVTGLTTGNSITPSSAVVTGQTMTVKSGALTVSVSSVPISMNVIAGASQFLFANYILDGTASGEDVRVANMRLAFNMSSGNATDVTNCQLYDGSNVISTSSVNPSAAASTTSFTLTNNGLTVAKGSVKTISMKCDVISGATGAYVWGIDTTQANSTNWTGVTGLTSGQTIAQTISSTGYTGQYMSATSGGTLAVVLDSNSPPYKIAASGQIGVELSRIRFSATNENINLRQVALILSSAATNTPVDLVNRTVTLWTTDGKNIGSAVFPTGDNATSSAILSGDFTIPKDSYKVLVVKGDIAGIAKSGPLIASGDLLIVDYDGANRTAPNGNYGVGASSGSNVNGASGLNGSSAGSASGVRIMKAYPTMTALSVPSTTIQNGANQRLYRFSVTANNGDVAVYKFKFNISSSTLGATTSVYSLYAYTDSAFSSSDANFATNGLVNGGSCINGNTGTGAGPMLVSVYPDKGATASGCNTATTTYIVPSGVTRYFELRATAALVSAVTTSKDTIAVYLQGDSAYPTVIPGSAGLNAAGQGIAMGNAGQINTDTNASFIWSPVSTTTNPLITDQDYTNGYQVVGLPSAGMSSVTFQSP